MAFSPDFLNRLKEALPLHEILGHRLRWDAHKSQPAKGDYWAPCPFHREKSASFHVRDSAFSYYCFGCGVKGDAITFLVEHDRMPFRDAVAYLAEQAGVPLPQESAPSVPRDDSLPKLMQAAHDYFTRTPEHARHAAAYVQQRGIDPATAAAFGIGYASDQRDGLRAHLKRAGFNDAQGIKAGLLALPDEGGTPYDRFRARIMFPVRDSSGRIISFAGRTLRADVKSKYINGPETDLFHKGEVLFNLHQARAAASACGRLIVCEGYFDVAAMHQIGLCETVAPMGTALTEKQMQLLWRHAPEPILCMDGDAAGQRAAQRALDQALPLLKPGRSLRFAFLPEGRDPDDFIRGGGDIRAIIDAAKPLSHILLHRHFEQGACDTPERLAGAVAALKADTARIADPQVRRFYEDAVQAHLNRHIYINSAPSLFEKRSAPRFTPFVGRGRFAPPPPMPPIAKSDMPRAEMLVVGMVLVRPDLLEASLESIAFLPLSHPSIRRVRDHLLQGCAEKVDSPRESDTLAQRIAALPCDHSTARRCAATVPRGFAETEFDAAQQRLHDELSALGARSTVRRQLRSAAVDAAEKNDESALDRVRFLLELRRQCDEPKDRQGI